MGKKTWAQIKTYRKYGAKTYERLSALVRKSDRLNDLVNLATQKTGESKSAYIIRAVRTQLDADGITLDMLPPLEAEPSPEQSERKLKDYIGYAVMRYYSNPDEPEDDFFSNSYWQEYLTISLEDARQKARKLHAKLHAKLKPFTKWEIWGYNLKAPNQLEAEEILKKMLPVETGADEDVDFPDAVYKETLTIE